MLLEAIIVIIAISIVFCCCSLGCYMLFHYLLTEDKPDVLPEPEVWEAKHYYDPLPLSTPSPPDTIFKPTPYTFKLQNGNGLYTTSISMPHAVINPAVLQYPPGHVLDQQRVHASQPTPVQRRKEKESRHDHQPSRRRNSCSRSPSPNPRRAKNVWSTSTEFQQPQFYYQHQRPHYHHQQQQQPQQQFYAERQYVRLTQEHYPVQPRQQHHSHLPPEVEEYHRQVSQAHNQSLQSQQQQQYEPFMASSHATNVYTTNHHHLQSSHHHHSQQKHSKSIKARHKEAIT